MIEDLIECRYGTHASNIGAILAASLAKENPVPIMIADPIVVDELCPEARYTGHPDYERTSIFHALNTRAVAKRYAEGIGKPYEALNLIMVHMGGGLSIGAHRHGRVIDVNNCLDGEGAFSTERAGSMPIRDMLDLCYSGEYTREEAFRKLIGNGGLYAYLGTKDGFEIQNRIEAGDEQAIEVIRAQAYQVAKEIGALAAVLKGDVDAILLTGGLAYLEPLTEQIKEHVSFIAPVELFPGEDEIGALALAAYEVMNGERELKEYA